MILLRHFSDRFEAPFASRNGQRISSHTCRPLSPEQVRVCSAAAWHEMGKSQHASFHFWKQFRFQNKLQLIGLSSTQNDLYKNYNKRYFPWISSLLSRVCFGAAAESNGWPLLQWMQKDVLLPWWGCLVIEPAPAVTAAWWHPATSDGRQNRMRQRHAVRKQRLQQTHTKCKAPAPHVCVRRKNKRKAKN